MTNAETDWPALGTRVGRKLARARTTETKVLDEAAEFARQAYNAGQTEVAIAAWLGVDRGTVRGWLGKERRRNR
jgi:hypothetical protein